MKKSFLLAATVFILSATTCTYTMKRLKKKKPKRTKKSWKLRKPIDGKKQVFKKWYERISTIEKLHEEEPYAAFQLLQRCKSEYEPFSSDTEEILQTYEILDYRGRVSPAFKSIVPVALHQYKHNIVWNSPLEDD